MAGEVKKEARMRVGQNKTDGMKECQLLRRRIKREGRRERRDAKKDISYSKAVGCAIKSNEVKNRQVMEKA